MVPGGGFNRHAAVFADAGACRLQADEKVGGEFTFWPPWPIALNMSVSGVSGNSSPYRSPAAADEARVIQVLKRQQDVARDVGQALVELISEAAPEQIGGRISVRA
jgi:hypothetical protein